MRRASRLFQLLAILLLGFSASGSALSRSGPTPRYPRVRVRVPAALQVAKRATAHSAPVVAQNLPPLKAVLIVAPVDGPYGEGTTSEKQNMEGAAAELQSNGVTVYKFYSPDDDWEEIKAAAVGAHFLFYMGHGVYWSAMPHPNVGGFALTNTFVSNDDIRNDLKLAPNAIVMIYGCFAAGSAGNDTTSITSAEARRRVAQYSGPFLDIGAAGYFSDWFGDAFQQFTHFLFEGQTLGDAYESFYDTNTATVERYAHPQHPAMALWLDKDNWYDPKPQYNDAFVGMPGARLSDLFAPVMTLSQRAVNWMTTPSSPPKIVTVRVGAINSEPFGWSATVTPAVPWLSAAPLRGQSGEDIVLTITPPQALGSYSATLRVVADDPTLEDADQSIPVQVTVVERVFHVYAPIIAK